MVVTRKQSEAITVPTTETFPSEQHRVVHSPPPVPRESAQAGPSGNTSHRAAMDTDDQGSARNIAQQEPSALPTSSGLQTQPLKRESRCTNSKYSHNSSTAKKLSVEAQFQRRHVDRERELLDRERQLALLQRKAEEMELQAKLAALEARSVTNRSPRTCSSSHISKERVVTWVDNQNAPGVNFHPRRQESTHIYTPVAPVDTHTVPATATANNTQGDPVSQLARAIATMPDRIKRTELVPFSGNINEWLAFKCTYERTKSFFTPADNLIRLIAAIRGAAKVAVSSILWAAQDPEEILTALEQNYARPELLVAHEIAGLRSLKISNAEHLNTLANKLRNCVATIKLLNQHEYLCSIELLRTVLSKLSEQTRDRFTDYAATHKPYEPTITKLELLSRFLVIEAERQLSYNFLPDVSLGSTLNKATSSFPSRVPFYKNFVAKDQVHVTSSDNVPECSYCKQGPHRFQGPHSIQTCKSFLTLSVDDRWKWVKMSKTCYRCLKSNPHKWNDCRAKVCGNNGCNRRHHKLLHGDGSMKYSTSLGNNNVSSSQNSSHDTAVPQQECNAVFVEATNKANIADSLNVGNTSEIFTGTGLGIPASCTRGLLKVLPVVLEGPHGTFDTFALLDEGSTATLIDGDIATRIGAETTGQQQLRVNGIGGMFLDTDVSYVNFHIRGRNLPERHLVQGARSITPLRLAPQSTNMLNLVKYDHLVDLSDLLTYENATPTVLIGAADWYLSASREMRVGRKDEPVASRTTLGWVLHGAVSSSSMPVDFILHVSETDYASRTIDGLEELIKKQYEIDSLGIQKHVPRQNINDTRAVHLVESSARRLSSGRFEVGLPWKENVSNNVPDSYPQASSRLNSIEKQMSKDETFALAYKGFIEGIIQKGYAEECVSASSHESHTTNKSSTDEAVRWYLPHFGVYHPQKRKLRVVHDAAAVTRGVSLNSMLLQGPDLLQSLIDILFRFREGPIAFNADIREMFPQIKIREQDRDALRFLWRDVSNVVKEYRMSSVIFGAVSSPFIALFIKNKNAEEFRQQYPAAVHSIIHDHYMDDYIGSEFELSDAARLASDIVTVHKSCCFEMRSWVSNVPEALNLVPKELRNDSNSDVHLPPNNDVGALGVKWNPFDDTLGFRSGRQDIEKLTKRSLLSSVMSIYDPLGLLTPVIIQGRILIQKLWREGRDWDSPVSSKYEAECKDWFDQLASTVSLRIPRCYESRTGRCDTQLHVIADGGEQAYACVAYWRYTFVDGSVSLSLIGSKARVAPLKPLSIPRLELQAALIATRFAQTILSAHRTQPSDIYYWTDSTTVLKWIRSDARSFKAFVAHRLGEILEFTNPSSWKWLSSELNIADDATKPKRSPLTSSHRWFAGPSFLLRSPTEWPCEPECTTDEASRTSELKSEFVGLQVNFPLLNPPVPDVLRFSNWLRLLRATARVLQGVRNFWSRSRSPRLIAKSVENSASLSQLSVADITLAEEMLWKHVQIDSFAEELKTLKASQPVPKTSRIAALAPVLDTDGLIRLDSRIRSTPGVIESAKSPIILDGRHRIVQLMILRKHIEAGHGNHELVLNEIRQKFWILRARSTIRSVAKACLRCRKYNGRPITPPTGNLPIERLDHHTRPFTHVGLDYFGPMEVSVGRRREKRYVALYTCLVTRAIHLEVVASLSSDASIMSLRRFIARRGTPSTVFSDNGTNFVGASRELKSLYDDEVESFATSRRISWRFIPPASPFMGGAWERMVRSVKTALRATLKERAPREEVLTTLLLEAESILNSRPLTYVPNSPDAPEAITPFHFILGSSSGAPWPVNLSDSDLVRRCDWRRVLRLADHFWARWLQEYLPTLIPRGRAENRQNRSGTSLCEGDVVLIADKILPRGLWLLGRVVKTFTGADGLVRVADVATKGGILRRPVRKLLSLIAEPRPVATRL